MRMRIVGAVIALAAAASPVAAQQAARRSSSSVMTLIGCVELESDYRKRVGAGRGGVLGTGIEAGDEYVLTGVTSAPGEGSGAVAQVYSVSGRLEKELKRSIGRQIEVVGFVENPQTASADRKDVADLPRVNVNVWHPVADFCPNR